MECEPFKYRLYIVCLDGKLFVREYVGNNKQCYKEYKREKKKKNSKYYILNIVTNSFLK